MLGDAVAVILDAGQTPGEQPSTIVDCTGDRPRVLRRAARVYRGSSRAADEIVGTTSTSAAGRRSTRRGRGRTGDSA